MDNEGKQECAMPNMVSFDDLNIRQTALGAALTIHENKMGISETEQVLNSASQILNWLLGEDYKTKQDA